MSRNPRFPLYFLVSMKKPALRAIAVPVLVVAIMVAAPSTLALAQTPAAADRITIIGQVSMGTPDATLPITTSLILHAHDGHEMALMLSGEADAKGQFRFGNLENKADRTFQVTALVGPTAYYGDELSPQAGQTEVGISITVYGTTADTSKLRVERMHTFVEFINRQQVRTTEIYVLSNGGDRTIEGGEKNTDGRAATLRFSLPAEASQVRFENGQVGVRFFRTADGFLDAAGVPPGKNSAQVVVSYVLPYVGRLHLDREVYYPIQATDVILPDAGVDLTGSGFKLQGIQQAPNGTAMKVFTGPALSAGDVLAYDLNGQPTVAQASLLDGGPAQEEPVGVAASGGPFGALVQALRASVGGSPVSAVLMGLGLLLLAAALAWWLHLRTTRRGERDEPNPEVQLSVLIQAIASLDEAHAAGRLNDDDHQSQRSQLLAELLALATQRHEAMATPGLETQA